MRIVNNAGHLVPQDCPEAALDLASGWVEKWKNVQLDEWFIYDKYIFNNRFVYFGFDAFTFESLYNW